MRARISFLCLVLLVESHAGIMESTFLKNTNGFFIVNRAGVRNFNPWVPNYVSLNRDNFPS